MALESGTYISDLVATNPTGSDPLAFADDHLRLLKSTIKASFPNITGAVTKTNAEINALASQSDLTALQTSLTAAIAAAVAASKTALYPVGSIYTNATSATNPATLLGFGTWVAFGAGRVPVGFNAADPLFDTAEETGGSKDAVVVAHTHTATAASAGEHAHAYTDPQLGSAGTSGGGGNRQAIGSADSGTTALAGAHTHDITVASTGSSGTNANLQPYITVYMWKRTV